MDQEFKQDLKEKRKQLLDLIKNTLQRTTEEKKQMEKSKVPNFVAAAYIRLCELRDRMSVMNAKLGRNGVSDIFCAYEDCALEIISTLDMLYGFLPDDHELRSDEPLHIRVKEVAQNSPAELESMPAARYHSGLPGLPKWNGRDKRMWYAIKETVQREILSKTNMQNSQQFETLLSLLEPASFPYNMVLNYAGLANAFQEAWKAVVREYDDVNKQAHKHLAALRNLANNRLQQPVTPTTLRKLVRDMQYHLVILGHSNIPIIHYKTVALEALQCCLPWELVR